MLTWKPTRDETQLIRECAARETGLRAGSLSIEPGYRRNVDTGCSAMNVAAISDDPDWDDTDTIGVGRWTDFAAGVPLTNNGRAIVDFYLYGKERLRGNLTVTYAAGRIRAIHGVGRVHFEVAK